jgi:hypothetical protein
MGFLASPKGVYLGLERRSIDGRWSRRAVDGIAMR